eukprot:scaffold162639_cov27-Prasinocladus_malaysianus.AAC.1
MRINHIDFVTTLQRPPKNILCTSIVFLFLESLRAQLAIKETTARLAEVVKITEPPMPPEEPEEQEDGARMYFTRPNQLLNIFSELEQSNLFLIQNSQQSEEGLEELRASYKQTRHDMEAETASLKQQIEDLTAVIHQEKSKGQVLKNQTMANSDGAMSFNGQTVTMEDLVAKLTEVYVQCGFDRDNSAGSHPQEDRQDAHAAQPADPEEEGAGGTQAQRRGGRAAGVLGSA